jgi:hypothetical protein
MLFDLDKNDESTRKELELAVLRWLRRALSPSRELLPSVLPSSSPLARPSVIRVEIR